MKSLAPLSPHRIVLASCLLIASCQTTLYHDTKTDSDLQRDQMDCVTYASNLSSSLGIPGNPLFMQGEIVKCMKVRYGWRTTP